MSGSLAEEIAAGIAPMWRRFTVDELDQMIEKGMLREGDPFELIDGTLILKDRRDPGMPEGRPMVHGPKHAGVIAALAESFAQWQPAPFWHVRYQLPIQATALHAPEPDAALVKGTPRDFLKRHPQPADVMALFEAAGTSRRYDSTTKLRVYSEANIPLYVLIDIENRAIERFESPAPAEGRYLRRTTLHADDVLKLDLPGVGPVEIPVRNLLPGEAD